jgi:ubiquinone/menaquinone biosynthesis C-methylase UbiE
MAEFGLGKDKIFPYKWAFTLLVPFRNIFLSPKQVINRLELKNDMMVLEIGSGPGYFSVKVAKKLKKGHLVIADIQSEMLSFAEKRIKKQRITNIEFYLCNGTSFDFKDETFDRIFMVAVLGEVEYRKNYMEEFYRILKKGGILSISELAGDADKMTIQSLKELGINSNFSILNYYVNKLSYTVNLKK